MDNFKNIFTIDLEDWITSSLEIIKPYLPTKYEIQYSQERAYYSTLKLLEILESYNIKATFFVLGTFAERFPDLIKLIFDKGHEIGSHTYRHRLVYSLSKKDFEKDLIKSLEILYNITRKKVISFRAPYFSIIPGSEWSFEIMAKNGILIDSSIYPIKRGLYGHHKWTPFPDKIRIGERLLWEFPITTRSISGFRIPLGGGGYLRIFPVRLFISTIKELNNKKIPAVLYIHPYEVDPNELEKYKKLPIKTRFSQNIGRRSFEKKLKILFKYFKFTSLKSYYEEFIK